LHYTIGNAFSALGDEQSAKVAYEAALADPAFGDNPDLAAQGHKNLGTSFERWKALPRRRSDPVSATYPADLGRR
jgi:hypothetical protein